MDELTFVPYEKRYHYPGMAPRDKAIWERFIAANPAAFSECAYNVAVGSGASFDTTVNPETGGSIDRLYQRKIDVIAKAKDGLVIIELKPRATTSAFGQVEGYAALFVRDFKPGVPVATLIITDELMPEMEFLSKERGIKVLLA